MKKILTTIALLAAIGMTSVAGAETARLGADYTKTFNSTRIVTKTSDYTVTTSDSQINCDATSAAVTATLPSLSDARGVGGMSLMLKKTDSGANACTFSPATGETVGGESARKIINVNGYIILRSGPGSDWTVEYESPYVVEDHEAGTSDLGTVSFDATAVFEGSTADEFETTLSATDPTADNTITIPDDTGALVLSTLTTNEQDAANSVWAVSNGIAMEGATANAYELSLTTADPTADNTITFPDASGDVRLSIAETTTATDTLVQKDCGKTIFLNSATEYATALPAVSTIDSDVGCEFTFVVKAAPSGDNYTITTGNSLENVLIGGINELEVDTGDDGPYISGGDTISIIDGVAVVGDWIKFISDGASWYFTGQSNADGGYSPSTVD